MAVLPERFKRIKSVLNRRIENLTVLVESVNKPHNLSAIIRSCDAAGVHQAHFLSKSRDMQTFNSTAQGSQKWVGIKNHDSTSAAISYLRKKDFILYGTSFNKKSIDYRELDFTKNTCFVLGSEKWGLSDELISQVDESIYIPMSGMVQSLNVSVAAAILLFEAVRQRYDNGSLPTKGEGLQKDVYEKTLFKWTYPELVNIYKQSGKKYPKLDDCGEIITEEEN